MRVTAGPSLLPLRLAPGGVVWDLSFSSGELRWLAADPAATGSALCVVDSWRRWARQRPRVWQVATASLCATGVTPRVTKSLINLVSVLPMHQLRR
jgi:hypothetical protein